MNIKKLKDHIKEAFGYAPRPEHFTNYKHCGECAEHDKTLRTFDKDTIGLEQLGKPSWDPMCFVTPDALVYYFPAMARLVIDSDGSDSYLEQFLFHMTYDAAENRFFRHFSKHQRKVTLEVLKHIHGKLNKRLDEWDLSGELEEAVALWTKLESDS